MKFNPAALIEERPEIVGGLLRSLAAAALFYAQRIDPKDEPKGAHRAARSTK